VTDDVRTGGLPYVDEHSITIAAPRDRVWAALRRYAGSSLTTSASPPLSWLLGTDPPGGFAVAEEIPNERLVLAGRHRFSRYLLVFELAAAGSDEEETTATATTYAAFPGPHGFAYRTLVIGSRGHAVTVNRMLRSIRHAALRPERAGP
jgi:hypothetical protein